MTSKDEESGDMGWLDHTDIRLAPNQDDTNLPTLLDGKSKDQPLTDQNKIKGNTGENFNPIKEVSDEGDSSKLSHQNSINRNSD